MTILKSGIKINEEKEIIVLIVELKSHNKNTIIMLKTFITKKIIEKIP